MKSFVFINLLAVLGSSVLRTNGQSNGDLRLVSTSGTTGGSSGRLEVYYSGQWGTVCDDSFGISDARVACQDLGFADYSRYGNVGSLGFTQATSSVPTWLDELRCIGSESRLINCPANLIGVEDCSHFEDVGLVCQGGTVLMNGDLRLVDNFGTTGGSSGRLEVYYNGEWGTVCEDSFGFSDAQVACRQLGFTSSSNTYGRVGLLGFTQASSSTRTWLDELRCFGTESRLINCLANPVGVEDCSHSEDIALRCSGSIIIDPPFIPSLTVNIGGIVGGIIGGVVGLITLIIVCVIFTVFICAASQSRRRRVRHPYPTVVTPASTDVVEHSNNTPASAYPLQQPTNPVANPGYPQAAYTQPTPYPTQPYLAQQQYPAPYPSGPQQPPAPYPTGQPPYSSGMIAPQVEPGEPKNPELYKDAPPAYPGYTNYSSDPPPSVMNKDSGYPGQ